MDVLTEAEVRTGHFIKKQREFIVAPHTMVTTEARAFIDKHRLTLRVSDTVPAAAITAAAPGVKPEHMTHLRPGELVAKDDARVAFRGQLDSMQAKLLYTAAKCQKYGHHGLYRAMIEAVALLRRVMAAEVKNEPLSDWNFLGLNAAELRERSHHPEKYYGRPHTQPCSEQGFAALELNLLRTEARELELAFSRAFINQGQLSRPDIAELLNRLSSGFYILYCRVLSGELAAGTAAAANSALIVPIETSARHVHLSKADVEKLFGPGHTLTKQRDLSQGDEFLSRERVTLRGPKGEMKNVAVLGPERSLTQIELSASDARALGVAAPLRLSGNLTDAADCLIVSERAAVEAKGSAIVARNHIHLPPADAAEMGLQDGQKVDVRVEGERPLIFSEVTVRVNPSYNKFMHIDFDEANAAMIRGIVNGVIVNKH